MLVQSTRSDYRCDDVHAVLAGIAPDGGLFVDPAPELRPFDWRGCLALPPLGMAEMLLGHLLPGFADMGGLVRRAYEGKFDTPELTPLVGVGEDYALELFHGPTSAFKDVALSVLPQLIGQARRQTGQQGETLILTATSGDTGKAALEGFHDVPGTRIAVFYPEGGVSRIQRAQMVTQAGNNVAVCAVRGNFDDCQQAVKECFAALRGREGLAMSSANSINIGRLAPQLVYYFIAYARLCALGRSGPGEPVDYVVPTGNFGDILAGYLARRLGLPVGRLVCASNANRVLTDFFHSGVYDRRREFLRTASPSMDILVSSNLERLLFYALDGDTEAVAERMAQLNREGVYRLPEPVMARLREGFSAFCCGEEDCSAAIRRVYQSCGYVCDPHTAVAFHAAERYRRESDTRSPVVVLSSASPYKFPGFVLRSLGLPVPEDEFDRMDALQAHTGLPVPPNLAALRGAGERHLDVIDRGQIPAYVLSLLRKEGRA